MALTTVQADELERSERPRPSFAGRHARIGKRQRHVAQRGAARQQVEALEDEADLAVPDQGELALVEMADVDPVEPIPATRLGIETAHDVHEGRLA